MLTENEVVDHVANWLKAAGWHIDKTCHDTARGDDIAATHSDGSKIFVECKGAVSRQGNELDSWDRSAMAIFGAIKETEQLRPTERHAIAVPDTEAYRKTIGSLNSFFVRQNISVLWVQPNGDVFATGAPNRLQGTDS